MTVEIGSLLGNVTNKTYGAPGLKCIFTNIIYTSVLMAIIILIILCVILPPYKTKSWIFIKLFIYIFLSSASILFIHKSIIKHEYDKIRSNNKISNMMSNIDSNKTIFQKDMIEIRPSLTSSMNQQTMVGGELDQPVQTVEGLIDSLEKIV